MPPSPGKIHSLPVKVLYNIDTSTQSYLTILHDRQDVYVHPGSSAGTISGNGSEGSLGSCTLKSVARGICFASPECIPNTTSLDFSVYNLDPTTHRPSSARAFPNPNSPGFGSGDASSNTLSWTGRGFLSWVLSENGIGTTLIKGRLVREYEFSNIHFAPEGGLEGLMAAAASSGNGNGNGHGESDMEDLDGKGWGLEVGISLRQLNPDGKIEFQSKKEFQDMLSKGKSNSNSTSTSITASSPIRSTTNTAGPSNSASTPIPVPRSSPLINSTHRFNGGTPHITGTPQPGLSASSTATIRPLIQHPTPVPINHQNHSSSRPSSSLSHRPSSSSMPPSSLPALPSSSNLPSSRPSSSTGESRQSQPQPQAPRPLPQSQSQSQPQPPMKTHKPARAEHTQAHAQLQAGPSQARNREVTPPPIPRSKSPPPSTPSRAKLHALLRADGMMSPDLARHLASNPVLLNLLKAVPTNSNALTALRNITGINKSPHDKIKKGSGSALASASILDDDKERDNSPEATTPTPSAPPLLTPSKMTRNMTEGCCNCGTMTSSCWRTKKMKDGTPRKVCDDCGLYFNEYKKMRPPELWNQPFKQGSSSTSTNEPKRKLAHGHEIINDGPASGLRSSPRLNRTNSDKDTHTLSSTGISTSASMSSATSSMMNIQPDSPRKRQKIKAPPPPSPRRATRASVREGTSATGSDFGAEVFGFSPNTSIFGTSPAVPLQQQDSFGTVMSGMINQQSTSQTGFNNINDNNNNNVIHNGNGITPNGNELLSTPIDPQHDIDINAFLAQMDSSTEGGFNLDNLFNGLGDGMGVELSQEMQDLLNGWETQLNDPNLLGNLDMSLLGDGSANSNSNGHGLENTGGHSIGMGYTSNGNTGTGS
ncbi:uncharacterized protein IL334_000107 [Kwoniella shivajii]|uniref:GATA-type domain-containing protein n=1 Tax=Kwoniella shivajii TaxID=564305 RepID=A0ABZ1CN85_9TREE|nr:hypothetical protein IL334_000107 [Kwoniella shivajii]